MERLLRLGTKRGGWSSKGVPSTRISRSEVQRCNRYFLKRLFDLSRLPLLLVVLLTADWWVHWPRQYPYPNPELSGGTRQEKVDWLSQ
jgi:hypothetical protein